MEIKKAYNLWAGHYDTNINKTRDLERIALREVLGKINFIHCLEIGCGTGKNTGWLAEKAKKVTAVDFSEEMLLKAKTKIPGENVTFIQADITQDWHSYANKKVDLITFSLILEHIENLDPIFKQASKHLINKGYLYLGELHPSKQYLGSKAKYDTGSGPQEVQCYTHHISEFTGTAKKYGLEVVQLTEYFDQDDKNTIPRIVAVLFRKKEQVL